MAARFARPRPLRFRNTSFPHSLSLLKFEISKNKFQNFNFFQAYLSKTFPLRARWAARSNRNKKLRRTADWKIKCLENKKTQHFFNFQNCSIGELVRFETWQRLWKRTRGLGVGPAAGRMGRFALELVDGDSFQCFSWKHWPARLLNNLPQNKVWSENLCNWGLRNLKWSRISPCLYFLAGLLGSDSGGRLRPRRPILNMEKQFVLCFFFLHVCWELHCFSPCLS